MMQVNILEAKNQLSQLIKAVQAGQEVVIANRGRPVAKLVSITEEDTDVQGSARAILDWLDNHPLPESLRRSAAEIEAAIEEERSAWD